MRLIVAAFAMAFLFEAAPFAETGRRAVVLDAQAQALIAVDVESGELGERLPVPVGRIYQPREPSRLILFSTDPTGRSVATIVATDPLRLVSTIALGTSCHASVVDVPESAYGGELRRYDVVQSADGRRVAVVCWGALVSLDLITGGASTLALPKAETQFYQLPLDRALLVMRSPSASDVLLVDLAATRPIGATRLEGRFRFSGGTLSPDGRSAILRKDVDVDVKLKSPSELVYFDVESGSVSRTVRLSGVYPSTRFSSDGRYAYASNMGETAAQKRTPRLIEIVSLADGVAVKRIPVSKDAHWLDARLSPSNPPAVAHDAPGSPNGRLLALSGDYVTEVPLPGAKQIQVLPDPARSRVFIAAASKLIEYSVPSFARLGELPLGESFPRSDWDHFSPSDDYSRIIWMMGGDRVRVLNTAARTASARAAIGTRGARARNALGDALRQGLESMLKHSMGGESVQMRAAFRSDSREAYALASTGELATIDLETGRVTAHRAGGTRLVSRQALACTLATASVVVVDRTTGTVVQSIHLDVATAQGRPILEFSRDGFRAVVAAGGSVLFLDGTTGRTIAAASGLGRIVAARFLN